MKRLTNKMSETLTQRTAQKKRTRKVRLIVKVENSPRNFDFYGVGKMDDKGRIEFDSATGGPPTEPDLNRYYKEKIEEIERKYPGSRYEISLSVRVE